MIKYLRFFFFILLLLKLQVHAQGQSNGVVDKPDAETKRLFSAADCDTLFSFKARDPFPTGLAFDGQYLYSCGTSFSLYRYDVMGNFLDSIPFDERSGLKVVGRSLYAVNEVSKSLTEYDLDNSMNKIREKIYPDMQNIWGVTLVGNELMISDYTAEVLYFIDTTSLDIVDSITLPVGVIGIDYIRGRLYGIDRYFNFLKEIDISSGVTVDSFSQCIGYPLGICFDGTELWQVSSSPFHGGNRRAYMFDFDALVSLRSKHFNEAPEVKVYPNPASGFLNVSGIGPSIFEYSLMDVYGKTILNGKSEAEDPFILDIGRLPNGIYLLDIEAKNKHFLNKLLIE